jgi:hypothetical protein
MRRGYTTPGRRVSPPPSMTPLAGVRPRSTRAFGRAARAPPGVVSSRSSAGLSPRTISSLGRDAPGAGEGSSRSRASGWISIDPEARGCEQRGQSHVSPQASAKARKECATFVNRCVTGKAAHEARSGRAAPVRGPHETSRRARSGRGRPGRAFLDFSRGGSLWTAARGQRSRKAAAQRGFPALSLTSWSRLALATGSPAHDRSHHADEVLHAAPRRTSLALGGTPDRVSEPCGLWSDGFGSQRASTAAASRMALLKSEKGAGRLFASEASREKT